MFNFGVHAKISKMILNWFVMKTLFSKQIFYVITNFNQYLNIDVIVNKPLYFNLK
jgi:hypothetical protein